MILKEEIFEKTKVRILLMKDVSGASIDIACPLSTLGFDSLDYIELQIFAQEEYSVKIADSFFTLTRNVTVGDVVEYIYETNSLLTNKETL